MQRANNRSSRVRMEAWRQWLTRRDKKPLLNEATRIDLTQTGLLMQGDYTQNPPGTFFSEMRCYSTGKSFQNSDANLTSV
jgi:hypothetical protein